MRKQRLYLDLKKERALTKPKREGRVLWVEGIAPANVMRWKLVQMKKKTGQRAGSQLTKERWV